MYDSYVVQLIRVLYETDGAAPAADVFFFSSRRRHTRCLSDWSSDVCSSDLRTWSCGPCSGLRKISSCSPGSTITGPGSMLFPPRGDGRVRSPHPDARHERLDSARRASGSSTSPTEIGRASCREGVSVWVRTA